MIFHRKLQIFTFILFLGAYICTLLFFLILYAFVDLMINNLFMRTRISYL